MVSAATFYQQALALAEELGMRPLLFEDKDGTIRIVGSRIPLDTIIYEFNQGATAEQIQGIFPSLSLRSIYGALAFYLEHQAAVEEYLRHREQEAGELRRKLESRPEITALRASLRHRRARLTPTSRRL